MNPRLRLLVLIFALAVLCAAAYTIGVLLGGPVDLFP